jgi:2-methylcitrate dehydratase PrpD
VSVHTPTLCETLAEFAAGLRWDALPDPVVAHAKLLLLDTLGAALAGVHTDEGRAVREAARWFGGEDGPAGIWGTMARATPATAALVNGTTAHAQELDDFGGCDHSGAVVVPAVLACVAAPVQAGGEAPLGAGGDGGRRVLTAMVVGYDVALRVLEASGGYRAHNGRGWHSTGTCGSFGAAAAAARVLGLDARRTAWALGLAGSFTGGTWAFLADGAMSKRYHPGRAAETGVLAAALARAGFTGPTRVFEAGWGGFLETYTPGKTRPAALTEGLGHEFKLLRSGVKPYASCRGAHATLDVVFDLARRERLDADDVARVEVKTTEQDRQMLGDPDPQTRLAAQMSLPYCVAVAWVTGRASLAEFEPPRLRDPAVRAFMPRVTVTADPALPEGAEAHVTVVTRDGRRLRGHVPFARGAPENPLTDQEVIAKYEELAARALRPEAVRQVREAVFTLDAPGHLERLQTALGRPR